MSDQPRTASRRRAPLPGPLGLIASRLYDAAISSRNRAFDAGKGVTRLPVPVVSIGNLSVGGTGKTPMVAYICGLLLQHGHRPCIAMRGYTKGPTRRSDEADAYRREFGEAVAIVAQPDRAAGVQRLLEAGVPVSVVVLDDGFQHRRVARDLDLVLVDASTDPFTDRLLPAGWLRESPSSLARASCVVLTHCELAEPQQLQQLSAAIENVHGRSPVAHARHLWTGLVDADENRHGLDRLAGQHVLGVCAIGNPRGFIDAIRITIGPSGRADFITLPDHDPFTPRTVARIVDTARSIGAAAIVVTDKDWSKLRHTQRTTWPCPLIRPILSMGFLSGREHLEDAVLAVASRGPRR